MPGAMMRALGMAWAVAALVACASAAGQTVDPSVGNANVGAPETTWACSVCGHVYDPAKDGNGLPFEQLPDTWKCPVCGAPKSAYKPSVLADGRTVWVHEEADEKPAEVASPDATWACSVCGHVYDPAKDGNGLPFEQLPDTWKCPVCGAPKSAYKPSVLADGRTVWVHEEADEKPAEVASPDATWTCSVCGHVYDPAKDGNGLPFEQLPDTWKCPVCGAPKSAYKPSVLADGRTVWVHEDAREVERRNV